MKNTHEHISFREKWSIGEKGANLLGQCYAYVDAMLHIPIRPDYNQELHYVSFKKGALATTAIEGNTMTWEELAQIHGGKKLQPSREYQQREVENVLGAFEKIFEELVLEKSPCLITPELIKQFHKMIGSGIGEAFGGDPGKFRRQNVTVGTYRPPSFELVEGLVGKLCEWLQKEFHYNREQNFDEAVIEAIVTHVYIEWIHPFMDGNGRTGRLLEFYLILRAGIPSFASHILSNHYNETRPLYYKQLQDASETGDLSAFITYALEGFRDGLAEALKVIHMEQTELTWNNYVHDTIEKIEGKNRNSLRRLRLLAYHIPAGRFCSPDEIGILTKEIAEEYLALNPIALRRDLDFLVEKSLLKVEKGKYRANYELLHSFMPEASVSIRQHF